MAEAAGAILAHGVRLGGLSFRKGRVLSDDDIAQLQDAGIAEITVARLEPGDVAEDQAAARISQAVGGGDHAENHIRVGAAFTGRANLYARAAGLALIDTGAIHDINAVDEAITVASLAPFAKVDAGQMLATIKIIPFAAPEASVAAVEKRLAAEPAIRIAPFRPKQVALISTRLPGMKPALLNKNREALDARLKPLGSAIAFERRVAHDIAVVADAIAEAARAGADPVLLFGASAIADRRDVLPAALERAGGSVAVLGMPVDPGNLLMAGTLEGCAVLGLPGCARSPKLNGFDFVLWRVLADLAPGRAEIAAMGVGGLLTDSPVRPHPRETMLVTAPRLPRIGAIILAAGNSSRMRAGGQDPNKGVNKLLQPLAGRPMVRHVAEAALSSAASDVVVVTGNERAGVTMALRGLPVIFADNPDYSKGLSTSLILGLNALPEDCDGAVILLGDMPAVDSHLLDRLIAAFDPSEDRAIIVASHGGRRGNPVLWARRFFPEMRELSGDAGARALLAPYAGLVCEVEAGSDAPLTDIDTEEALFAYRARIEA
ncbi:MAG TPA: molybdopterin-binding/glycosyltransferase family 2 protein [Rhizomicrobium sp.]|nr:molybdopterin-binding/glycosyltransferase family 2 protein [Rhizomicrobium sp.]